MMAVKVDSRSLSLKKYRKFARKRKDVGGGGEGVEKSDADDFIYT